MDRTDTWTKDNPRPRWQTAADTKRHREARRRILACPRCAVCNQPMTCGQTPTHLSCRTTERTTP